jgi:hypothetical protein
MAIGHNLKYLPAFPDNPRSVYVFYWLFTNISEPLWKTNFNVTSLKISINNQSGSISRLGLVLVNLAVILTKHKTDAILRLNLRVFHSEYHIIIRT